MKDFFKKFTNLRTEDKKAPVLSEQQVRHPQPVNNSFSLSERIESHTKFSDVSLLVGFFKAHNNMWAPFFMDEREYDNYKTYGDGGVHIRSRREQSARQTMPHPFMYGVMVHLLEAFSTGTINDLKKITNEYRSGVTKLDFSSGYPVIVGLQNSSQKEDNSRPQQPAAPARMAQVQVKEEAIEEPAPQPEVKAVEEEIAHPPVFAEPIIEKPVQQAAPVAVVAPQEIVAEEVQPPVKVTTLAELLPGIGEAPANANSEHKSKAFNPVSLPYNGLSEALNKETMPHVSSSSGGFIQYSNNRLN